MPSFQDLTSLNHQIFFTKSENNKNTMVSLGLITKPFNYKAKEI